MKKFLLFTLTILTVSILTGQNWVQKNNFPGTERYAATGFAINGKLYFGTGYNGVTFMNDWWEYDPVTDQWTQKASFPGAARFAASAFTIGSKGYVIFGSTTTGVYTFPKDFWEYDPVLNVWNQKADFPGLGRYTAVALSINGKGYVGTGWKQVIPAILNDWWEYDPLSNSWTQKANFGGGYRRSAMALAILDKAYVGMGDNGNMSLADLWEYNPQNNLWMQKANFIGSARAGGSAFSINNIGYFGLGGSNNFVYKDFFKYDPVNNFWAPIDSINVGLSHPVAANLGSCGYVVTGKSGSFVAGPTIQNTTVEFWEYCLSTNIDETNHNLYNLALYPNPTNANSILEFISNNNTKVSIEVYDMLGKKTAIIYNGSLIKNENYRFEILKQFGSGMYNIKIVFDNELIYKKLVISY